MEELHNINSVHDKLTEDQIIEIQKRAIEFTYNTLGKHKPNQMCYTISYPLSIHLTNNNIKNSIKFGRIEEVPHYWINLDYVNGFIIDATAKQFDHDIDYVAVERDCNFQKTYEQWSQLLVHDLFDGLGTSIEPYIRIGVKASIILIRDNKLDNNNMKYIDCICLASKRFYGEDLQKLSNLPNAGEFVQFYELNKNRWI
jgi:hypothetical protein